jgi:hypothetical protein
MSEQLEQVLALCRVGGRVCPQPLKWNDLYQLLPGTHRVGGGWEPPAPLILGAWHYTDDAQKAARLKDHIEYAAQHGALDQVAAFLKQLGEADWHHEGE